MFGEHARELISPETGIYIILYRFTFTWLNM